MSTPTTVRTEPSVHRPRDERRLPWYHLVLTGLAGLLVAIAVLAIVAVLLLPRRIGERRPGVIIGWVVQALLLASGFVLTSMFFVAALFIALWAVAVYWSARIDREVAARD